MISINLLPVELKLKRLSTKRNAALVSICIVVVFFFIVLSVIANAGKGTIEDHLAATKTAVDKNTNQSDESKALQEMALLINDRSRAFTEINKKRAIWSQILTELSASAPIDVQFDNLTSSVEKSPNFTLQGNTTTEREIIKFKEKLENSPFFKNVAFKSSSLNQNQKDQTETIKFILEFDLEKYSSNMAVKGLQGVK